MKAVFICINGINADPSNQRGWTDEMASEINRRTPADVKTEKFEYHTTALLRRLGQSKRAQDLVRRISGYNREGWRVVLIGHSNGCDLISRVLDLEVPVFSVHLFAPAAEEEPFALAIQRGVVRRVHIYGSPDDMALKSANWTQKVLRYIGLGYGSLGLRGGAFAAIYPRSKDHSIKGYGHSTWFKPGPYFEATLSLLLRNDAQDVADEDALFMISK